MSIKKNYFYNGILLLSQYVIPLFIFPYVSRVLGIEKIGLVNWIDATLNYFILFSSLGLTFTGIRETTRVKGNKIELSKVFSELLVIHILFTLIISVVYVIIVLSYAKFSDYKLLFFIGFPKLFFNVFLIEWFYRGIENFKFITIRSIAIKLIYMVAVFIFVTTEADYVLYFILTCAVTFLNAGVNWWYSRDLVTFSVKSLQLKRHYGSFFMIGLYNILTSMYTTFNLTFLGIVVTQKAVGSYSTALKLYTIILGLFSALNTVLISRLSSLISENNIESFNSLVKKSMTFVVTLCFPIIICFVVLAPELIRLLAGGGYEDAIICFQIIIPLILIVGLAQVFSNQVLMSLKKDKSIAYTACVGAFLGIVLNIVLVPRFAEIGTSFVVLISEVAVTSMLYYYCHKFMNLKLPLKSLALNCLLSVGYLVICYFTKVFFTATLTVLIISAVLSAIYFLFSQLIVIRDKVVLSQLERLFDRIPLVRSTLLRLRKDH